MRLIEVKDKKLLDDFVGGQKHSQFLQSWKWGEFQERMGNKVLRLGVEDPSASSPRPELGTKAGQERKLVVVATLIKKALPGGRSYFYCPRGPVEQTTVNSKQTTEFFFKEIEKMTKSDKVIFLRFETQSKINNLKSEIIRTIDVQPSKTLILDLGKTKEELLANMHQKTRYNIRLAERKGVKIMEDDGSRFEEFWKLMQETNKRDAFRLHGKEYYEEMVKNFQLSLLRPSGFGGQAIFNDQLISNDQLSIKLFLAEFEERIIAGNIIAFFGDTVTYIHGASANKYRNVMAPHLLQWHCIKLAKKLGYKYYDFYGIDEKKWPGVTRFKKGFGGEEQQYPGTYDLVFSNGWYMIYKLFRKIRRFL